MQCANCGAQVFPGNQHCGRCGAPLTDPDQVTSAFDPTAPTYVAPSVSPNVVSAVPAWPKVPPQRRPEVSVGQRLFGRPPGYPNVGAWLVTGMFRDWRGLAGALLVSVFNVPIAFLFGGLGLVGGGIAGFVGGFGGASGVPGMETLQDIPAVGTASEGFLFKAGGVVGLLAGMVLGGIGGFLYGLVLPWVVAFEDPAGGLGLLLGQLFAAFLLGLLYSLYRIAAEGVMLRLAGARVPSRREQELLMPLLRESAERLKLGGYPKLLMDDAREPNAYCGARHIVVSRGLLDEFNYDPEPLTAVLCHELAHWRNADAVSSFFIRGMVLPYYLLYVAATWVMGRFSHPVVRLVLWAVAWPLLLSIRYVIMPLQAMGSRASEYSADQGAVAAGHRQGLRRVLSRFRATFDGARNGWDASVCATHPPNELRLERIEEPGVSYPLPDPDAPARPLPVVVSEGTQTT